MKKCFTLFLLNKVKGTELSLSSYQLFDELVPKPLQNGAAPLHNTGIQDTIELFESFLISLTMLTIFLDSVTGSVLEFKTRHKGRRLQYTSVLAIPY